MNAQLADELIRLLGIKRELLAKMLESLRRSVLFLQEDDMDAFDSEMDTCKEITSMVDELGLPAERIRDRTAGVKQDEVANLEKSIAEILAQIDQTRQACNDAAQQKLQLYGQQIKAIRHTQRGIDGYANRFVKRDAVFIDEKK